MDTPTIEQATAMMQRAPTWQADCSPLESAKKRIRRPAQGSWRTMVALLRQKRPVRVSAGTASIDSDADADMEVDDDE